VTLVIFPACAALAAAGARGEVRRLAWPTLAVAGSLGCGLAILGILAAPLLQAVLLGPDYAHVVPLLRLLMLAVPGLLLGGAAGYVVVALGLEGRALVVAAAALALHAALATWLIPAWGAAGAAAALATALIVSALGMAAVCAQALRATTPQAVSAR
jgi:O-antigen/teichoic acid export membrane protein